MKFCGTLSLRERIFQVREAKLAKDGELWSLEIETKDEEFDGETWSPYLYHQGLKLGNIAANQLAGMVSSWHACTDAAYPHPELGILYVFGHEPMYECELCFGPIEEGRIEVKWTGLCDVFWDDTFKDKIVFALECHAELNQT